MIAVLLTMHSIGDLPLVIIAIFIVRDFGLIVQSNHLTSGLRNVQIVPYQISMHDVI